MSTSHRIGLIVPSSNTTMETEIPELLRRQQEHGQDTFTFHSSRMRMCMQQVSRAELARMDGDSDRCALELSDARCDVLAYACWWPSCPWAAGTAASPRTGWPR
ncbi:MAG: hypothetical protein ACYDC9_05685 [Dermatophilaceae bacterium]